jgi:catechol 2,3-dioxygenase-like lactoylglutathione lyase family enzyme
MPDGPGIVRIGQVAIPVADLERAVAFYSDVLGLRQPSSRPLGWWPGSPTTSSGWHSVATRRTIFWGS